MSLVKKLKIKDGKLREAVIEAEKNDFSALSPVEAKPIIDAMSPSQLGTLYMVEYISSLLEIVEEPGVNLKLDLTYETIKNLPGVIAHQFMVGKNSRYSLE